MEDAYIVRGGAPLRGKVQLAGAKNVALKVLIASLLFDSDIKLSNIPRIKDIDVLIEILTQVGVDVSFTGENRIFVKRNTLSSYKIDLYTASKIRTSFMLFVPLLRHFGKARIPNPGGCRLGQRPIDRQIKALKAFGVEVAYNSKDGFYYTALAGKNFKGATFRFNKKTHTGTEFAIMLAVLAEGESVIENASQEPEIDDLINFFNQSGAEIKREEEKITIKGVKQLKQEKPFGIMTDRNEAVTYAIFGLATEGDVTVEPIDSSLIESFIAKVEAAGGKVSLGKESIRFQGTRPIKPTDIMTRPYPHFMTDWQAPWAVLMTQASGKSVIHETVFEDRFSYVDELRKLGAKIKFFRPNVNNPHNLYQFNLPESRKRPKSPPAIKIFGKTDFHNAILNVSDLRAGASLLIAASVAGGESVVKGASVIDRGYEKIDTKLKNLGAKIRKI